MHDATHPAKTAIDHYAKCGLDSIWNRLFQRIAEPAILPDTNIEPIMNKIVNRRDLLSATATAGICVATVGSALADPKAGIVATHEHNVSPELAAMIEPYKALVEESDILLDRMERVWENGDRPRQPCVKFSDVYLEKMHYQPAHRAKAFTQLAELDLFFDQTKFGLDFMANVEAQRQVDWQKARDILSDQIARFEAWDAATGYSAMHREEDTLFDQKCDLEDAICDFACRSLGDIIIKITFANTWLPSGDDDDMRQNHARILTSMAVMAA